MAGWAVRAVLSSENLHEERALHALLIEEDLVGVLVVRVVGVALAIDILRLHRHDNAARCRGVYLRKGEIVCRAGLYAQSLEVESLCAASEYLDVEAVYLLCAEVVNLPPKGVAVAGHEVSVEEAALHDNVG